MSSEESFYCLEHETPFAENTVKPWESMRELASSIGINSDTRNQAHTALKAVPKADYSA